MKKVLVFLLTLGLAANMFAIDLGNGLTLEGEVKTGFKVETKDDSPQTFDSTKLTFKPAFDPDAYAVVDKKEADQAEDTANTTASLGNNDAGATYRVRLTASYAGDLAGAKLQLEAIEGNVDRDKILAEVLGGSGIGVNVTPNDFFYAKSYYGWGNFLDKKVVVYGGKIADNLWGLGNLPINAFDPSIDTVTGVRAAFNVVEGLSFGFALPFDQIEYAVGYDNTNNVWIKQKANRTLGAVFGGAAFGGLYKSDFISAAVGVKLSPAINSQDYLAYEATHLGKVFGDTTDQDKKGYGEKAASARIIAGVSVKPIDPLTVVLDADIDTRKYDDSNTYFDTQKIGYALIGLKGEYTVIPALKASLKLDVLIQNDSAERNTKKDGNTDPFAQYYAYSQNKPSDEWGKIKQTNYVKYRPVETYGDMAVGFEIGATYTIGTIAPYLKIGSDNLLWIAGDVELKKNDNWHKSTYRPGAGVWVKPGVTIALGGASIEIFDKIGGIGAAELEYFYTDNTELKIGSTSAFTNQFQVDFNWKF